MSFFSLLCHILFVSHFVLVYYYLARLCPDMSLSASHALAILASPKSHIARSQSRLTRILFGFKSLLTSAFASEYVSICQHMSAYVSIRQHTSVYVGTCQHMSACVRLTRESCKAMFVSIRQHTSAYASIRQHTSAYVVSSSLFVVHLVRKTCV